MSKTGILLAGGSGTRLNPLTGPGGSNKHLLPVHNKFIIDYSLKTLTDLGCEFISVILGGQHHEQVVRYLGNGDRFNCRINYLFQGDPLGIAHGISLSEKFITEDSFYVVLGDNVFDKKVKFTSPKSAEVILVESDELERFGTAFCDDKSILYMIEKPNQSQLSVPHKKYALSGAYKFDHDFFKYFSQIQPSARGEYEIVDVLNKYRENDNLGYSLFDGLWSDAGTFHTINKLNNHFYMEAK